MLITIDTIYKTKIAKNSISREEYKKIIHMFIKFLVKKLMTAHAIVLPFRIGELQVRGKLIKPKLIDGKIVGLSPDWKRTNELWNNDNQAKQEHKIVYFFNEHSNGIRYKFFFSKRKATVKNKTFYSFVATRTNKRELATLINSGREYFINNI